MKFDHLYCLKVWDERSGRIRRFFCRKSMVVAGSDRQADIRLSKLRGFDLRLDFNQARIVKIENGDETTFPEKKIASYGAYAFVWSRFKLSRPLKILVLIFLGISLTGFALRSALQEKENCQLSSSEDIKSFRQALKTRDLVKARSELSSLIRLYRTISQQTNCSSEWAIETLQLDYEKIKFLKLLPEQPILVSIEHIKNFRNLSADQRDFMERKILTKLRERYFEAYRMEDDDDSVALAILSEVHEACRELKKEADCFRGTKTGLRE